MDSESIPEKVHKKPEREHKNQGECSEIVALLREGEATDRKETEEARIEREKERQSSVRSAKKIEAAEMRTSS